MFGMPKIERFEDIQVWQEAREFIKEVYTITRADPLMRDFGLSQQLQRASVSIMSNIAEGFERGGNKEFLQFLSVAKASAGESRSLLYTVYDLGYINTDRFELLKNKLLGVSAKISRFMEYLKSSNLKGSKYNKSQE
jgi:four helix bundle protein